MNITDRKIVLNLNANFQAINISSPKSAFIAMMGGDDNNPPVKALDIVYPRKEDGSFDLNSQPDMIPVTWQEWLALPIYEHHLVVNTSKMKIRVPTVVVSVNYYKVPKKRFRPTKSVLYKIQKGICGITGKKMSFKEANIEHKIPKSKGGKDTFENLMAAISKENSKRGNKSYQELNIKPLFSHKEPAPMPVSFSIDTNTNIDCKWFIS